MDKPTDADILGILEKRHSCMTYVIRNWLWSAGFRRETPWVLRQLKRLERDGKVHRVSTSYATQFCWSLQPKAPTHDS
jgi:hypothetical protein